MTPPTKAPGVARLILVKHARPELDPGVVSHQWRLGEAGRQGAAQLAQRLAGYAPGAIVSSQESKAAETGQIVAARLGLPFDTHAGLGENDRTGLGFLPWAELETLIAGFFAQPGERVMGGETANEAYARFAGAVAAVLPRFKGGTGVIVAHGTVISLWVSRVCPGVAPLALWKRLGLPSFLVLSLPGRALIEVVETVDQDARGPGVAVPERPD